MPHKFPHVWGKWCREFNEAERGRKKQDLLRGIKAGSDGKESACNAGDPGSILELGRIPWTEEPGRPQPMGSQRAGRD